MSVEIKVTDEKKFSEYRNSVRSDGAVADDADMNTQL